MTDLVEIRAGAYRDSVTLMQVSRDVAAAEGVEAALIAMATELNLDILADLGFTRPAAGPNDLVIAVRAASDHALTGARDAVEAGLRGRPPATPMGEADEPPRTTGAALARSGASLALVSVPGPAAFGEAMDALESGAHVMVFSDNVPVEQEIRLKDEGARRGLLVMGPDCGTALVGGVGLGFANVVRPGPVGIVAASGTGAQQLLSLLDGAGVGVRACLGVGGRDLSSAVRARSTRQALRLLDEDPATDLIVVVSKPPAEDVEREVREFSASLTTPVQFALLGRGRPDLTQVARAAVAAIGGSWREPETWLAENADLRAAPAGALRGLFAGGTLCDEAMAIAAEALGPIASNIPLDPAWALADSLTAPGHVMVDFGDDQLTRGRPHPMIDQRSRLDRLAVEAADPDVTVLLLDVVLGHGAHPDPAAELAPAIRHAVQNARADGRALALVVSLCGTEGDPQGLMRQAGQLRSAGADVLRSNAAAARRAVALLSPTGEPEPIP